MDKPRKRYGSGKHHREDRWPAIGLGRRGHRVTVLDNDKPIAAVMNFYFRDEVLPYYGGGTSEARQRAGNDFMYWEVMRRAGEKLAALGAKAVLMKGGHLEGDRVIDLLFHGGRFDRFEDARIKSRSTHGTGCTLASSIAAGLAQGMSLVDAVMRARGYVRRAIETAPGFGRCWC